MKFKLHRLALAASLVAATSSASAITISGGTGTTGTFSATAATDNTSNGLATSVDTLQAVTGFTKFDASLGVLTGVSSDLTFTSGSTLILTGTATRNGTNGNPSFAGTGSVAATTDLTGITFHGSTGPGQLSVTCSGNNSSKCFASATNGLSLLPLTSTVNRTQLNDGIGIGTVAGSNFYVGSGALSSNLKITTSASLGATTLVNTPSVSTTATGLAATQTLMYTYLKHSNASFTSIASADSNTLAPFTMAAGAGAQNTFSVFNKLNGFDFENAKMDAGGYHTSGDLTAFTLSAPSFTNARNDGTTALGGGSVAWNTAAAGNYSSTYTLNFNDAAATSGAASNTLLTNTLSMTVNGTILNHSNTSFSALSDVNSLTAGPGSFTVTNLAGPVGTVGTVAANFVSKTADAAPFVITLGGNLASGASATGNVALNTATPGNYSKTYTLSYVDAAAPGGLATADANTLTLNATGTVLNHSLASFSGSVSQTALTQGTGAFSVFNTPLTTGGVGSVAMNSFSVTGGNAAFTFTPATATNLIAGGAVAGNVALNTDAAGNYNTSYTLTYKDAVAPGGAATADASAPLTLNVSGTVLNHATATLDATEDAGGNYSYSITNLLGSVTGVGTVGLDLTDVLCTGDCSSFSNSLTSFADLIAGSSITGAFSLLTSAVGDYAAHYTFNFLDHNGVGGLHNYQSASFRSLDVTGSIEAPVVAVPEPETYALLLAGLGSMIFVARRRRNNEQKFR